MHAQSVVRSLPTAIITLAALGFFVWVFGSIYFEVYAAHDDQQALPEADWTVAEISTEMVALAGALATFIAAAITAVFAKKEAVVSSEGSTTKAGHALRSLGVMAAPMPNQKPTSLQFVLGLVYLVAYIAMGGWGLFVWVSYSDWTPEVVTTFVAGVVAALFPMALATFSTSSQPERIGETAGEKR